MKPIEILKNLDLEQKRLKYPNTPYLTAYNYKQNTANGLTRCIIDYINFIGGQAERINTTGRVIDNTKTVKNVIGQNQTVGSKQYIPTTGTKGSADISALYLGKSYKIEVKIGKDRQSEAQKDYQMRIEAAGGVYYIAKSFDEFYAWVNEITR